MTTVVYDGKFLAADRLVSKRHLCRECNKIETLPIRTKRKIYQMDTKFRGSYIKAVSGAGDSAAIDKAVSLLRKGEDIEVVYANYFAVNESESPDAKSTHISFTLLIITNDCLYTFETNRYSFKVDKKELSHKISIGSGSQAAMTLVQLFDIDAATAVLAASVVDTSTGSEIDYIDTTVDKDLLKVKHINKKITENNIDEISKFILSQAKRNISKYESKKNQSLSCQHDQDHSESVS